MNLKYLNCLKCLMYLKSLMNHLYLMFLKNLKCRLNLSYLKYH